MASLYLHIPFCEKKCIYCDFYSIENFYPLEDFLRALHREIDMQAAYAPAATFETVFFGGGTPSLLSPGQVESILTHLHRVFSVGADAEITLEANPGTVTKEKLTAYRSLGVNRLSFGVQSFHNEDLKFLSRIHDSRQAFDSIACARDAGFSNLSIDLIYALPGQSMSGWEENLRTAVALGTEHISAYGLIVEDHTPLARMVQARTVSPKPADEEALFYERTMAYLEQNGFEHYEVSNYARPGFRSRHNYNYWRHVNYLGFGPSAHSFWNDNGAARRWHNIANLSHYCTALRGGRLPLAAEERLTLRQLIAERIFLGLRSDGIDIKQLERDFSSATPLLRGTLVDGLVENGSMTRTEDVVRLTSKGYLLCDEISERLVP